MVIDDGDDDEFLVENITFAGPPVEQEVLALCPHCDRLLHVFATNFEPGYDATNDVVSSHIWWDCPALGPRLERWWRTRRDRRKKWRP